MSQYWFGERIGAEQFRHQAITWTNDDPDHCCLYIIFVAHTWKQQKKYAEFMHDVLNIIDLKLYSIYFTAHKRKRLKVC